MSKQRKIIIAILGGLIILVAGFMAHFWQKNTPVLNIPWPDVELKKPVVERNLTDDERKIYNDRLKEASKYLGEVKSTRGVIDTNKFFRAYMNVGFQYYGLGDLEKAQDNYRSALSQQPENSDVYNALYLLYIESENFDAAKDAANKSVQLKADNSDSWRKLLELNEERFNPTFEDQQAMYKEALQKTSRQADILILYGRFLDKNQKTAEALEILKEAQKIKPGLEIDKLIKNLEQKLQGQK